MSTRKAIRLGSQRNAEAEERRLTAPTHSSMVAAAQPAAERPGDPAGTEPPATSPLTTRHRASRNIYSSGF